MTDENDSHGYLRAMEERGHHCVILQKSDEPGTVEVMGFKTFDEADLDKAEAYFKNKGRPTQWVERSYQGRTLLTSDNTGIPLEFYHKMNRLEPIHQKYALYRGSKPLRIEEKWTIRWLWHELYWIGRQMRGTAVTTNAHTRPPPRQRISSRSTIRKHSHWLATFVIHRPSVSH